MSHKEEKEGGGGGREAIHKRVNILRNLGCNIKGRKSYKEHKKRKESEKQYKEEEHSKDPEMQYTSKKKQLNRRKGRMISNI